MQRDSYESYVEWCKRMGLPVASQIKWQDGADLVGDHGLHDKGIDKRGEAQDNAEDD